MRRDRGVERGVVERRQHRAVRAQAFAHAEPQLARHQRLGRRRAQVVAVVLQPLAHLDDVAMAFGGEQRDLGALAFEQRIGRDRRAVHDALRVAPAIRCAARPSLRASSSRPASTPIDWSCGVDGDLAKTSFPCASMATRSVNVPPTSMPMVYVATSALRSTVTRPCSRSRRCASALRFAGSP